MRIIKLIINILIFCLLTLLTQVGGIVYLISILTYTLLDKANRKLYIGFSFRLTYFLILYCLTTFLLVPFIAKPFGRVSLPITKTNHLQPLNILTCILNRNYVKPELKKTAFEVAELMNEKYPGTITNYLDANFPFIDKFPLLPHLSHSDGKKLDLAFCYIDAKTGNATNECPSKIGYGICEEPRPNEKNTAEYCDEKGFWQYSLMLKLMPQTNKQNSIFDSIKTKELVNLFAAQSEIGMIFIEPHLKMRMNLSSEKIKFHGCHAVRHDDHVHIQLK